MISPWKTSLPLEKYSLERVVIYFHNDEQWVPIKHCYLLKAVALYQKTIMLSGKEVFAFPPDLDPNIFYKLT
ncbi:hypothetical protein [Nostoc sp. 106C]|uniref:hypothetical protein n=1 Tax=Nostoc sp. 106C TaxID=1932667 RepID=UPI000A3D1C65|nr:hypothetical protein [Nostoc sp. 106C]OUL25551.1 hypothetical protein BV375_22510 [Nostoc sp. 106C]